MACSAINQPRYQRSTVRPRSIFITRTLHTRPRTNVLRSLVKHYSFEMYCRSLDVPVRHTMLEILGTAAQSIRRRFLGRFLGRLSVRLSGQSSGRRLGRLLERFFPRLGIACVGVSSRVFWPLRCPYKTRTWRRSRICGPARYTYYEGARSCSCALKTSRQRAALMASRN